MMTSLLPKWVIIVVNGGVTSVHRDQVTLTGAMQAEVAATPYENGYRIHMVDGVWYRDEEKAE